MARKKRPSLSAMEEFDLEAKIQQATRDGIKTVNETDSKEEPVAPVQEPVSTEVIEKQVVEEPPEEKVQKPVKPSKRLGRPKKNPYPDEKKLTIRMPESLHRQLRFASADTGKPMVEIAIDALIQYLDEYKKR